MKHIKKFEKQGQSFWIYTRLNNTYPQIDDIQIFEDKESAENFLITEINEIAKDEQNTDNNLIFTYKDAQNYISENEYAIDIVKIKSLGKFELSEELIIDRDAKKYNL